MLLYHAHSKSKSYDNDFLFTIPYGGLTLSIPTFSSAEEASVVLCAVCAVVSFAESFFVQPESEAVPEHDMYVMKIAIAHFSQHHGNTKKQWTH